MNTPTPNNESELDDALEQVFINRILFAGETSEIEKFNAPGVPSRDLIVLLGCGDDIIKDFKQALLSWRDSAVVKARINEALEADGRYFPDNDSAHQYLKARVDIHEKELATLKERSNHEA